jgi:hypothetical protein
MIGAAIRARMRARPVGDGRTLAYGGYAYLEYSPDAPYEVRLVQPGPYPIEVIFARDILASALAGEPGGQGEVRARLEYVPAARHSMVLIAVDLPDYPLVLALDDKAVAGFLGDTESLVPFGQESRFIPDMDAGLDEILRDAA